MCPDADRDPQHLHHRKSRPGVSVASRGFLGVAVNEVGGEPAVGKGRAIVAPEDGRRPAFPANCRSPGCCSPAIASRCSLSPLVVAKALLVDINLHRDRYARKAPPASFAVRDRGIDSEELA